MKEHIEYLQKAAEIFAGQGNWPVVEQLLKAAGAMEQLLGIRDSVEAFIRTVYVDGDAAIEPGRIPDLLSSIADAIGDYRDTAAEKSQEVERLLAVVREGNTAGDADLRELIDRSRGIYTVPVNDGAGPLNGKTDFTRVGPSTPIGRRAAVQLERLQQEVERLWRYQETLITVAGTLQAVNPPVAERIGPFEAQKALEWVLEQWAAVRAERDRWAKEMYEALEPCTECDFDEASGDLFCHCDECKHRATAKAWELFGAFEVAGTVSGPEESRGLTAQEFSEATDTMRGYVRGIVETAGQVREQGAFQIAAAVVASGTVEPPADTARRAVALADAVLAELAKNRMGDGAGDQARAEDAK